jgi:hypothetical protein
MLRQFAGLLVVFFGGLAARYWLAGDEPGTAAVLAVVAATAGALGLIAPSAVRPIFVASIVLTFPIGWVISRVILVLLFACAITPVALLFRMRGRDVLGLRPRAERTTYWTAKPPAPDLASYFRQF